MVLCSMYRTDDITIFPACLAPVSGCRIVSGLCDENLNFTESFGVIFSALRIRYGGIVGLSVISHLSLGGQSDFLIKLSCIL